MARVVVEVEGSVAMIRLSRPDKLNALDLEMFDAIVAAGEQVAATPGIRAVVVHGEGRGFCSGLDVASVMASGLEDASKKLLDERVGPANLAQRVSWVWQEVKAPVIFALHGVVYGGGLQIALGGDIRIATEDAKFSVREIHWGLIPDMGLTKTLCRHVRPDVAKVLTFTGKVVSGTEALGLGLVTSLAEDPLTEAKNLAAQIAGRNPHAVQASKRMFNEAAELDVAGSFLLESELQRPLLGSANQIEAVMSNMQKRPANFADPE